MSASYYFKCLKCDEIGGQFTRQAWGWGNLYVINTFKFLAFHTSNCGPEHLRVVDGDTMAADDEQKMIWGEKYPDFVEKTKDFFPAFETEYNGKPISIDNGTPQQWYEDEKQKALRSREFREKHRGNSETR